MADDKKPIRWEISKKTGNKRPVYLDDNGKEYYGEVIKATSKDGVEYDVADEQARAKASEKGYEFIDPAESFKYKQKTVGAQSKFDPESGFYYTDIKPGKAGLEDFVRRHKDIIEEYPGGESQWRKDQVSARGKKNPAMTFVVDELNKRHKEISGDDLVDVGKPAGYVPGVELFNLPGISRKKEEKKPKPDQDITLPKKEAKKAEEQTITRYPPRTVIADTDTPYYKQDKVKIAGDVADYYSIPRYQPWQATPQVYLPEATFYDPTRELAANTEQANLANQYAAAFTGPQRLAAAQSVTQGQALKNAADIMARYNNLNVGVSNQLEAQRAEILNTAAQNKANLDTQLWDKYTVLNQQFDNSKAMARQKLRQSYIDAITNRAKAQALNTMYPNYYTDPSTGGMVLFHPDYTINPTQPDLTNDYTKALQLTGSPERALDYLRIQKGLKGSGNTGISERDAYMAQQAYDPSYAGMQEDTGE